MRLEEAIRSLLMFGHGESVFKAVPTYQKNMEGAQRRNSICTYDDQRVMLCAFQSREFCFGFELSKEQLEEVNYMRNGKKYQDEEAAKKIRGKADKNPLECSPFTVEFDIV